MILCSVASPTIIVTGTITVENNTTTETNTVGRHHLLALVVEGVQVQHHPLEREVIQGQQLQASSLIYFENGTCKCPNANVGDTATISGTTYTVVDNSSITGQIANNNVNLCTTKVTDMSELFRDNTSFNLILTLGYIKCY